MENLKDENISFNKMCDDWLMFKKNTIKDSTYSNYKFKIDKYFKKDFANKNLSDFTSHNVNQYIEKLKGSISARYLKDIISVFKSILKYAERMYDKDLKLDLISSPSSYQKEIVLFNEKERKKLEKYLLETEDIKNLGILISLFSGLRIGEVCALRWRDIDFEKNLLSVNFTVQRIYLGKKNTKVVINVPKTRKSIRKIPLSKVLIEKLKPISKDYSKNAFIITGDENRYVEPLGYRFTYKKVLKDCNIEYKKFHSLRHTFATRCIWVGMDIKSLSEILGHSTVTVTLNIYVHSSYETKKKFIDKL